MATKSAIASPLSWRRLRSGIQVADVLIGHYKLVRYPSGWSAMWCPAEGRSKHIAANLSRVDGGEEAAKQACERHRLEYVADLVLTNAGDGKLADAQLAGPAAAFRKGRRAR
jgi:hypothetical protein